MWTIIVSVILFTVDIPIFPILIGILVDLCMMFLSRIWNYRNNKTEFLLTVSDPVILSLSFALICIYSLSDTVRYYFSNMISTSYVPNIIIISTYIFPGVSKVSFEMEKMGGYSVASGLTIINLIVGFMQILVLAVSSVSTYYNRKVGKDLFRQQITNQKGGVFVLFVSLLSSVICLLILKESIASSVENIVKDGGYVKIVGAMSLQMELFSLFSVGSYAHFVKLSNKIFLEKYTDLMRESQNG